MRGKGELERSLVNELYALADMYGLDMTDTLKCLASVQMRIVCANAPDRRTAEEWRLVLAGALRKAINDADQNGTVAWSRIRMH